MLSAFGHLTARVRHIGTRPPATDCSSTRAAASRCCGVQETNSRGYGRRVSPDDLTELVLLRRARDFVDRNYRDRLSVPVLAERAAMSPAHFSRRFRAVYGETPYTYLMTRRIERAMMLLRNGATVTDACFAVGCVSLGSFSSSFRDIVGESPSRYRDRDHSALATVPSCIAKRATRPLRTAASA